MNRKRAFSKPSVLRKLFRNQQTSLSPESTETANTLVYRYTEGYTSYRFSLPALSSAAKFVRRFPSTNQTDRESLAGLVTVLRPTACVEAACLTTIIH